MRTIQLKYITKIVCYFSFESTKVIINIEYPTFLRFLFRIFFLMYCFIAIYKI